MTAISKPILLASALLLSACTSFEVDVNVGTKDSMTRDQALKVVMDSVAAAKADIDASFFKHGYWIPCDVSAAGIAKTGGGPIPFEQWTVDTQYHLPSGDLTVEVSGPLSRQCPVMVSEASAADTPAVTYKIGRVATALVVLGAKYVPLRLDQRYAPAAPETGKDAAKK